MTEQRIAGVPKPVGAYSYVCRAGNLLFLSGVGPRLPETDAVPGNLYDREGILVGYDIEQQCHSVFANIRAILEHHGANWDDLVDVTVFLTDMQHDFGIFNRVYAEYFLEPGPCRTTIEVGSLPTAIAIELKCIAYIRED